MAGGKEEAGTEEVGKPGGEGDGEEIDAEAPGGGGGNAEAKEACEDKEVDGTEEDAKAPRFAEAEVAGFEEGAKGGGEGATLANEEFGKGVAIGGEDAGTGIDPVGAVKASAIHGFGILVKHGPGEGGAVDGGALNDGKEKGEGGCGE